MYIYTFTHVYVYIANKVILKHVLGCFGYSALLRKIGRADPAKSSWRNEPGFWPKHAGDRINLGHFK